MPQDKPFLGLRTVIYPVRNLDNTKQWYTEVLGIQPYFDEPFYVGFNVGGFELGLDPDTDENQPGSEGAVAYWGVDNAAEQYERLLSMGATPRTPPANVGDAIVVATVFDPEGNVLGIIQNPHFKSE